MDEAFGPAVIAIYTGDLLALEQLLAEDPRLARRESTVGHPTLLQLIAGESSDIADPVGAARLLLNAGARTTFPLITAAGTDARAVLELLLESGVPVDGDEDWTPLDEALYWSNSEVVSILIERGAETRSLRAAAGIGDTETIRRFLPGGDLAARAGPIRSPFLDTISDSEADDPQAILDNALVMATNNRQLAAAKLLFEQGASPNAVPPGYHWRGTALHAAVWRGDRETVEWLVSVGADPSIRDGLADSDAAGWANHHGHPELLDLPR